jgi:hypothetical protein
MPSSSISCSHLAPAVHKVVLVVPNKAVDAIAEHALECSPASPRDIRLERPRTRILRRYGVRMVRPDWKSNKTKELLKKTEKNQYPCVIMGWTITSGLYFHWPPYLAESMSKNAAVAICPTLKKTAAAELTEMGA